MNADALRERLVERAVAGRWGTMGTLGFVLSVAGLLLFVAVLLTGDATRGWQVFHVNWVFWTGLAGGSLALTAVHKIANAKWSGVILRFSQAAVAFLPISFVAMIVIYTVGYGPIYEHMQEELHGLPHAKEVWLSYPVMVARMVIAVGALFLVGWAMIKADLLPDLHAVRHKVDEKRRALYDKWLAGYDPSPAGAAAHEARIHRLAPTYAVLYAVVFSIIAFDAIMALQPHWFSNLFGGWYFMGSFLGGHTLLAVMMIYGASHLGISDLVSPKQRHDLGKLIFGFSVFWTYLMWSQFLVIWYGNMPEETGFVFSRLWGDWRPIGVTVFAGMFLVPFAGLIGEAPKKNRLTLGVFALVSLTALWIERYLLVMPSVAHHNGPQLGMAEVGPTLLFLGLFLLAYSLFARTFPMISPRLAEITLHKEHAGHGH
jgi:hypothetical protein